MVLELGIILLVTTGFLEWCLQKRIPEQLSNSITVQSDRNKSAVWKNRFRYVVVMPGMLVGFLLACVGTGLSLA